jgi:hypothetical protein
VNRAPFLQHRRSARSQAGLTLVEVFLAITLTALLSVPVFGMVIVVLRTGGGSDSVLSQQADEINVQLQRNLRVIETESQLREDWRQASIIKVNPPLDFGQGIECNNGTSSAALSGSPYFNVGPIVTLQRPALNGQDLNAQSAGGAFAGKVPGVAGSKGMVRVVYNLVTRRALGVPVTRPDGSYLRDLVRRECAVESTGLPAVRAALPSDGCPEVAQVPVGYVTTDCAGWRLKPGTINSGFLVPPLPPNNIPALNWPSGWTAGPLTPKVVLEDVRSITALRISPTFTSPTTANDGTTRCNYNLSYDKANKYDPRCNVELTVTFGDNRTQVLRLYQGFGF